MQTPSRKNLYNGILSKLRGLMIARMAKPEEVIVVEDENGNIVRETMKDTDTLARYKTMHETLVYLSNLGHEDTETQMLEQLRLQVRQPLPVILLLRHSTRCLDFAALLVLGRRPHGSCCEQLLLQLQLQSP